MAQIWVFHILIMMLILGLILEVEMAIIQLISPEDRILFQKQLANLIFWEDNSKPINDFQKIDKVKKK